MHTSINNKSNGIEISFDSKPDSQTLYLLREQLGFKWSSKNKVWYRRDINKSIIDLLKSREVTAFEMLTLQSIVNEAAKTETQYKWLADALNDYQTDLDNDFELEVSSETISRLKKIPTIKPLKPAINKTSTKIARLSGLEMVPADNDPYEAAGLGKAVVGNEVYQIITDMVLKTIKESKELVWRKPWKSIETYGIGATNFHTKKAYRGANSFLLNFIAPLLRKKDWDIPYFLTFNQVEKLGGKVKKDAKGYIVTYYQVVYKLGGKQISEEQYWNYYNQCRDKDSNINRDICKKLDDYAMLKYYKVFNADDIEGIDWKLEKVDNTTTKERIAAAEAILLNYPKPKPSFVSKDADQAYYMPATDEVNMPPIESFEKEPFYYSVFFHELIHSTGHKKRLNREKGGRFGDKKYSFEELIAELGATLLCGQSGILYHTINNSSAYLKGWMEGLVDVMSEDNTFFMKAAGKAQAGADFILQPDKNGVPAYLKPTKKVTKNFNN